MSDVLLSLAVSGVVYGALTFGALLGMLIAMWVLTGEPRR